jgi:hypothetical protein
MLESMKPAPPLWNNGQRGGAGYFAPISSGAPMAMTPTQTPKPALPVGPGPGGPACIQSCYSAARYAFEHRQVKNFQSANIFGQIVGGCVLRRLVRRWRNESTLL